MPTATAARSAGPGDRAQRHGVVVRLAGELDLYNADAVRAALLGAAAAAARAPRRRPRGGALHRLDRAGRAHRGALEAHRPPARSCSRHPASRPDGRSRCRGSTGISTSSARSRRGRRRRPRSAAARRLEALLGARTASSAFVGEPRAARRRGARSAASASFPRRRASSRLGSCSRAPRAPARPASASPAASSSFGAAARRRGLRRRRHPGHRLEPGRLELLPQDAPDQLVGERRRGGPRRRPDPARRLLETVSFASASARSASRTTSPRWERKSASAPPGPDAPARPRARARGRRPARGAPPGSGPRPPPSASAPPAGPRPRRRALLAQALDRLGARRRELVEGQPEQALQLVRHAATLPLGAGLGLPA